ncbi:hypothetical protein EST38_g13454 [Candolleomyces aberdarensis]|uniref:Uncharacterized protein n=1 Tax=Candolleomyces aberdarensis TaxID=2316362 RepID=A0A4Q2CZR6_9AGAR|nr:hypothetical protein EST38_g13454 [Candolleomyces aberdarensis]
MRATKSKARKKEKGVSQDLPGKGQVNIDRGPSKPTMSKAQIMRLRAEYGKRVAALGRAKYGPSPSSSTSLPTPIPQPPTLAGPLSEDGKCPRMSTGGPIHIARRRAAEKAKLEGQSGCNGETSKSK